MKEMKINEDIKEKYSVTTFDSAEYLDNDELIALYLSETLKEGTDQDFIEALNTVARAKGMNELAKKAGIGRESLYQTLNSQKPRFESIRKILDALNIELIPTVKSLEKSVRYTNK
ncbi:putative addiction module antidote protein [Pelistega sp. NLN82]|uniref:Putative addiction module antidote protein n=1 Tax=Pelistega ratti TaxID=2652177 RepID=A0A6L9Y3M9_9BURK|nr:addiction module antidote protein [Pelistega ratti]NEN74745.1 putative addiction module antidote protein [Pelistega ratti]